MFSQFAPLVLLPLVSALPYDRRSIESKCGQYETVQSGQYSMLTNLWGLSDATSGSQCSTLESVHDNTVIWTTEWTWAGGKAIKSFSNIQLDVGINEQLSSIASMPTTWKWLQTSSSGVQVDVAYDLFTSYSAGGPNVNEVMIWLASYDVNPISYEYDYSGVALALVTGLDINGHTWNLYRGYNNYNMVYTFVPTSGVIKSFSGDIFEYFSYLISNNYIEETQYLITAQAGTEATSGSAKLTTSHYSLEIISK